MLSDLKDKLGGWRKDATAAQVGKLRMAKGGAVPTAAHPTEVVVEKVEAVPVGKRRGAPEGKMSHPVLFAKGGTVEADDEAAHDEGKAGSGTRGAGEPDEADRAEYEGKDAVDDDFPGASDDDESDIEVEKAVEADTHESTGDESFDELLKRLRRG